MQSEKFGGKVATWQPDRSAAVLVTGANGRIGRALRAVLPENRAAGLPILWHGRQAGPGVDLVWDIGTNPPVVLPKGLIILHLAGRPTGDVANHALATEAVCHAANAAAARHVFVMSSAAVYAPGPEALREDAAPGPVSDYGRAKLAAEQVAHRVLQGPGLTLLRLANVAGADALLGGCVPGRVVVLDPVAGQAGGPERSYIGPRVLADVLVGLVARVVAGRDLPLVLNVAQPRVIAMADLLAARGQPWAFGPVRAAAIARVVVDTSLLQSLISVPVATAAGLVADMDGVPR